MPTRALNLQFPPIPENASKFAEEFVGAVLANEKIALDYASETIKFADDFLQRFRDEGLKVNDFAVTIFAAACYVGEVMIRNTMGNGSARRN